MFVVVSVDVVEFEVFGYLVVELNCFKLLRVIECVEGLEVDFGIVEGVVVFVDFVVEVCIVECGFER